MGKDAAEGKQEMAIINGTQYLTHASVDSLSNIREII
jgi:hypothetical protein